MPKWQPLLKEQKNSELLSWTSLRGDFYEREIVSKFNTILLCTAALKYWQLEPIFKNTILVVFVIFMTSHYNQRYLLNASFLDYCAMIRNNWNVLTYIAKKLFVFPAVLIVWVTVMVNQHYYWFLAFNLFGSIINIMVLTFVYWFQMLLKIPDQRKMKNIEVLTFIVFSVQLVFGYGASL